MIITTEKGTIKSDSGMILTDGATFGTEYKLADDRNMGEFWEISPEEYLTTTEEQALSSQSSNS